MGRHNIGAPELNCHRSEVVLDEAADRPPPQVLCEKTLEANGPSTKGVGTTNRIEGARRIVTHLRPEVSNWTDRPLSPGPGGGEIRVENGRVLVVRDIVFSVNFPVGISCEVPVAAPQPVLRLPRQSKFRLDGEER